jgi:hypothetical protein
MMRGAGATRPVVQFTRVLFRKRDEIGDGFDGQRGIDDQHEGNPRDERYRREILGGVV